ncbi:putative relaxase/mobilization nuclease, partial [Serratia symbiotica str. Tucson]
AAEETLREKYPENRVLMAYHTDKEHHPHVHALLRIPDNGGKRINIRKKDLRELREKFAGNLQKMGYNVKCTHKYEFGKKEQLKREPDRLRNLFEVVEPVKYHYPVMSQQQVSAQLNFKVWERSKLCCYFRCLDSGDYFKINLFFNAKTGGHYASQQGGIDFKSLGLLGECFLLDVVIN